MARTRYNYSATTDPCLLALAAKLEAHYPLLGPGGCLPLAQGYAQMLRRWCWQECTDLIPTPDDVEKICNWPGPVRTLYRILCDTGVIDQWNGCILMPTAVTEMPAYVRARWTRRNRKSLSEAQSRRESPEGLTVETPAPLEEAIPNGNGHKPTDPRVKVFVTHWAESWAKRYGAKYPWQPREFAEIKRALTAVPDVNQLKASADAYLQSTDRWLMGHGLSKLFSNLSRFVVASARPAANEALKKDIDNRQAARRLDWLKDFYNAQPEKFAHTISKARDRVMETKGADAAWQFDTTLEDALNGVTTDLTSKTAAWLMAISKEN
jgi:hypothetical protein